MNSFHQYYKNKYVFYISSLLSTICTIIVTFLTSLIRANDDLSKYKDILLPNVLLDCLPETELMQYAIVVIIFPTFFLLFCYMTNKYYDFFSVNKNKTIKNSIYFLFSILSIFSLIVLRKFMLNINFFIFVATIILSFILYFTFLRIQLYKNNDEIKTLNNEDLKLFNNCNLMNLLFIIMITTITILSFYALKGCYIYDLRNYYTREKYLILIICIPLSFALYFAFNFISSYIKSNSTNIGKIVFLITMVATLLFSFLRIYKLNFMMQDSNINNLHFYAWWYPIYKVYSGLTIGIDFENIYGFYPYILVFLLNCFGGVKQSSLSLLMAFLLIIVSLGYFVFCYRFIKNKLLAALTATVCSFYGPFSILNGFIYLQYHPNRTLFLSIILICISIHSYLKNSKFKILLNIITCVICGVSIMWNIESGIIFTLLWLGYLIYISILENGIISKKSRFTIIMSILSLIVSLFISILLVQLFTYTRSGKLLTKEQILFGINIFAGTGFYMLPISFNVWVVVAIILSVGLINSIFIFVTNNPIINNYYKLNIIGLFVMSITGIGAFSYFVGRSYPTNVFDMIPQCIICCSLLIENYHFDKQKLFKLLGSIKNNKFTAENFFINIKMIMCFSVILCALLNDINNIRWNLDVNNSNIMYGMNSSVERFEKTSETIKEWADKNNNGEIPSILTYYSIYLYENLNQPVSESVCEMVDWFYRKNAYTYIEQIQKENKAFVISDSAKDILDECYHNEYSAVLDNYVLSEKIDLIGKDYPYDGDNMYIYIPKNNANL